MDIVSNIISRVSQDLSLQIDNYIIEGLKRKGYSFDNRNELYEFIKKYCRAEENTINKERIYYVKNVPFMLHKYENELSIDKVITDDRITFTATCGSYTYL